MAKQLNVSLAFSADTSQAKAQIQNLQTSLNNLMKSTNVNSASLGLNAEINSAINNVAKLKASLSAATNVKTGGLDLGKFNESLRKSGKTLSDYAKDLKSLGPQGSQAFSQLAQAITTAEVPLRRTNTLLHEFGTTLKNTARWQISSSVLHGLQGAMQGAWSYAKDLNESLNDIRIVTGQSVDEMAKFADYANKAAKGLGTTTTKYTDAALIYYQQGLSDQEVQKRTDATMKMANVTGDGATDVSSYMTAIWNNFAEGSDNLEYFADVITKLGAETAASSAEIAGGLEKFAAIGETVGLSYEYATAALTTIIDKTRQSEDVVGTALKTIFARIQGLKLGETLEDGVDLNKYSEALQSVGISIFDQNGELREMDSILEDMGAKWEVLSKAQQVALAQTVGGVRQYNQLISLMDNWDSMQKNLDIASGAEGTLQQQQDIYAESWEAASKRVKASLEDIYSSLIDDEFIIDLTNGFADFLDIIDRLIDSMGGFKGIMMVLGSVMMKTFSANMVTNLENMAYNIRSITKAGKQDLLDLRQSANQNLKNLYKNSNDPNTNIKGEVLVRQANLQDTLIAKEEELIRKGKALTEEEKRQAQILLDINKEKGESIQKTIQELTEQKKVNQEITTSLKTNLRRNGNSNFNSNAFNKKLNEYEITSTGGVIGSNISSSLKAISSDNALSDTQKFERMQMLLEGVEVKASGVNNIFTKMKSATDFTSIVNEIANLDKETSKLDISADKTFRTLDQMGRNALRPQDYRVFKAELNELADAFNHTGELTVEQKNKLVDLANQAESAGAAMNKFSGKVYTAADGFVALSSMLMNVTMAIQGIKNLGSIWENEDLSTGEKILQTMTGMSMILPTLVSLMNKENYAKLAGIPISLAKAVALRTETKALEGEALATKKAEIANYGLAKSWMVLKASVFPLLGILAALVALLVVWYQKTHEARLELKEAKKDLEDAENAFNNVAISIENVNSALSDLDSAYDTLKDLKYGSAEWQKELDKINTSMSDIIDKYGLIEGKDYFRNNELALELTEDGRNKINDANLKQYTNAKYTVNAADFAVQFTEVEALKETILNSNKYKDTIMQWKRTGDSANLGYMETSTVSLSPEDVDKIITSINTNPTLDLSNQSELIKAGFSEGSANLITSNSDLQTALKDLAVKVEANTQSYAERLTNTIAGDKRFDDALDIMNVMQGVNTEDYRTGVIEKAGEEIAGMVYSAIQSGKYKDQEIQKSYIDDYAADKGYKKDGDKYYETNENGDIDLSKEVKIDSDQLEYWIAQTEAVNEYLKSFDKVKETINNSEKVWAAADNIKKSWGEGKKSLDVYKTAFEKHNDAVKKYGKNSDKALEIGKTLDKNKKELDQYVASIKTDFQDLLGINEETASQILTSEFVVANADIIEGAINGNIDDLERLGEAAALQDLSVDVNLNDNPLKEKIEELHSWLSAYDDNINLEIGANINDEEFINKCNEIIAAAGMTSTQAQEYFKNMGYDVELNPGITTVDAWEYALEYTNVYDRFNRLLSSTPNIKEIPYKKKITAPTIKTITPNGKGFGGNVIAKSSGGSGGLGSGDVPPDTGGGSKTKVDKIDTTKKTDIVDRYKEINDSLEDQSRLLDKVNDQTDRLYGKDKIENLKKANKEIEKENKLLQKKQKEATNYLKQDKKSLQSALDKARKKAGLKESDFKFDGDGDIKNYESQMTALYKKLNEAETAFNKKYAGKTETDASKAAKEKVEELQETIDALRETIEQYDETKTLIEDLDEEIRNNLNEIQDNNYEALTHEIELRVQINDNDKKELDYYFSKLDDDIYKAAEALAILYSTDNNNLVNNAMKALNNNETAINNLKDAYEKGDISQEAYLSGMQEQHDSIYDNLEALQDLDRQMKEYYGETLDKAAEELAKYTDHMDALTGVLEHYKSILELTGKGQDYKAIDTILQGQAKTIKNNYEVSKKNYEMLLKEKEEVAARLALMDESSAGYEIEKAKLDELTAATDEAYEEMLSDAEEYLSTLREIWENSMDQIKEATEKTLTGGVGFDSLIDSMNRMKDYQSEYLTATNQLFETNKMLNDIQRDIDKTSNVAAKQRLNNFATEIEQLQKKGKLSNLELEIAQAKYKQLQAQIALEEAQNAKSVVRLSRDNEGNYGYVYTADKDAIKEAEDQLSKAENDLYNIRLNATNKYGEKMAQAWQEYMDECDRITREHVGTQEELDAKLLKLQEEFYRDIEAWSELYAIAQEEDTRVVADAWVNQFDVIKNSGDDWKTTLNDYTDQIMEKWIEWQATSEAVTSAIGIDMDNLAGSVEEVTKESDKMAKTVVDTVIPALEDEIKKVDALTFAYGEQRKSILALINAMELLAKQTQKDIEEEIGLEPSEEDPKEPEKEPEPPKEPEPAQEPPKDSGSKQGNGVLNRGDEVTFVKGEYYYTSNGDAPTGYHYRGKTVVADMYVPGAKKPWHISTPGGGPLGWLTKSQLSGYDTGGYTGAWGPEGKIAMLHEKEIVLNKEDTTNILRVVELVRAMIDSNAASAGLGVLHSPGINTQNQNFEQKVTITAEFPNATNHSEIEMAFDTLINRATQYANRK